MKNRGIRFIVYSAIIAAMYIALTYIASLFGLSSMAIQCRFSEALTVLPAFTLAAVSGLTIGCLLSNIITGCIPLDILFGTIATLIGAIGTFLLRKYKYLAPIPPILANTLIVPFVLKYAYGLGDAMWYLFVTVFAGEVISCGILGTLLTLLLRKTKLEKKLFD